MLINQPLFLFLVAPQLDLITKGVWLQKEIDQ